MKIRQLLKRLIEGCGDIDEKVQIKIVKRNEHGAVTHAAYLDISYFTDHFCDEPQTSICVEHSQVVFLPQ